MNQQKGFTLIELMIVIAIVGILAAIAIPAYNENVTASRRADAMSAMAGFASAMEREFTNNGSYANADGDVGDEAAGANAAPVIYATEAPLDGGTKYYDLVINQADRTSYILRAIPKNAQAGDGFIELRSTGEKFWDRNNNGALAGTENCWKKSC
ncbi:MULTISPECIES: type IV pilin protein [Dasania]|uniref:type IV pilin protein n=1 Tax=Dasania TaxID=503005 RepID=UPI00281636FF|nr:MULTISPECIES: type IV pilin protein [Dasania]